MPRPTFENKYAGHNDSGYAATNEEPEIFRRILTGKRFRKVATIASAGEIPFLVLASISKEIVAIDHSYRSLCVCFIKALMLDLLGAKEMKRFLIEESYEKFTKYIRKDIIPLMPDDLRTWATNTQIATSDISRIINSNEWRDIRREWQFVPIGRMERLRQSLGKVKFVHGDMLDIAEVGPFDLLYISNALDHTSRPGPRILTPCPIIPGAAEHRRKESLRGKKKWGYAPVPKLYSRYTQLPAHVGPVERVDHWLKMIRPGGWLMAAGQAYKIGAQTNFKLEKSIAGIRTSWQHELFKHHPKGLPKESVAGV